MQTDHVAFRLFGIAVCWYGLLIALGLLMGFVVSLRGTDQPGVNPRRPCCAPAA